MTLKPTSSATPPRSRPLRGPFTSFDIALHNIRENLISKYTKIRKEDVLNEVIKEIITLSSRAWRLGDRAWSARKRYLEFPVAACWPESKGFKDMLHWYSGEFPDAKLNKMPEDVKRIKWRVSGALETIANLRRSGGTFENRFAFRGNRTQYPESLRYIDGFWRIELRPIRAGTGEVEQYNFLIFYRCSSDAIKAKDISAVRQRFKNFLESGLSYFLGRLVARHDPTAVGAVAVAGPAETKVKLAKDVPVLEDIVTRIQDEVSRLKSHEDVKASFRKAFWVVFVHTAFNKEGKLSFRYIFTNEQRRFLRNMSQVSLADQVRRKRSQVFGELSERFREKLGWAPGKKIDNLEDLAAAISASALLCETEELCRQNEELEELLRTAIFVYYAFQEETLDAFFKSLAGPAEEGSLGLAYNIESDVNWVSGNQAFLIRQILTARTSDIVSDFINHPFSKYAQYPTPRLIDIFQQGFPASDDREPFYPRVLHLFEMLFFPPRFFMYPIYQYSDVPLLLCAFDADYHRETRSSLKGIVDRYVPAIFTSLLAFQLSETIQAFASVRKDAPVAPSDAEKDYRDTLEWQMKHLLRLFCREMTYAEQLQLERLDGGVAGPAQCPVWAAHEEAKFNGFLRRGNSERALVLDNGVLVRVDMMGGQPRVYGMGLKLDDWDDHVYYTIIGSMNGRHLLKLYLEHYAEIFRQSAENISLVQEVERSKLSSAVAHAVKTSLSPLSSLSDVFVRRVNKLDKLINNVNDYMQEPDTRFGEAYLDTSEISMDGFNSVGNVLAFYAEDAEHKVGLLYGGVKKDHLEEGKRKEEMREDSIRNYIVAGLVRGHCIALIRGTPVDKDEESGLDRVRRIVFEINGMELTFQVKDVKDTLELARRYDFGGRKDRVFSLRDLMINNVAGADFHDIPIDPSLKLPRWQCKLLMIVIEELSLNAVTYMVPPYKVCVASDADCLFDIRNFSNTGIHNVDTLKRNIRMGIMGGLHTAYFMTVDSEYLAMSFRTVSPGEGGGTEPGHVLNNVRIGKRHG